MRKPMLFILIFFVAFPLFSGTYAYIENDDITVDSPLSSFSADATLVLDMREISKYNIGFSRTNSSSSPDVISSFDIRPTLSADQSKISATSYIYVYWDIVSNLSMNFSISMRGKMENADAPAGYDELDWKVTLRDSLGTSHTLSSADNNLKIEDFASYSKPQDALGSSGTRSLTVSIDSSIENLWTGIYTGSLSLEVEVV